MLDLIPLIARWSRHALALALAIGVLASGCCWDDACAHGVGVAHGDVSGLQPDVVVPEADADGHHGAGASDDMGGGCHCACHQPSALANPPMISMAVGVVIERLHNLIGEPSAGAIPEIDLPPIIA